MSTTFSAKANKLSFVAYEGEPSRSKKKQVEKAVRVQAAKASATARKATIARKAAAKLHALPESSGTVNSAAGDGGNAQRRRWNRTSCGRADKRDGRVKQSPTVDISQRGQNPSWQAQDDSLGTSQPQRMPVIQTTSYAANVLDGMTQLPSSAAPSGMAVSPDTSPNVSQTKDDLDAQPWHSDFFSVLATPSQTYPDGSVSAVDNTKPSGFYYHQDGQNPLDVPYTSCDPVHIPQLQYDDDSPLSSNTLCSPVTPIHNDCVRPPWSQFDPQINVHNKLYPEPTETTIMPARLLEACNLVTPPLVNLFHGLAAYDCTMPDATLHLRRLSHEANMMKPRNEDLCQMSLVYAEAQNYVWSGVLSYVGCLWEVDLHQCTGNERENGASAVQQLRHASTILSANLPISTQLDGVLLWSVVTRCMFYHNVDTGSCNVLKTLLSNLGISSFQELKELLMDFAYHADLFDERLTALWTLTVNGPFGIVDSALR